ncbi:ABC transporter substrate-binding protein [Leucobacter luti]|uniref:ABC-type Fe3+-hydroxamate transport system substrate-binding protein n=1 Tax=Leucobacter luti TaxID=340320 RepID=A0A4Q7TVA8_9MICO|nr:ABC transporter substrate-binding protein [Leucobacter luti]RZT64866.1 ABC-type Fe3+-hydroxamate transport system substrate-binding protein [Leucobacter luti]
MSSRRLVAPVLLAAVATLLLASCGQAAPPAPTAEPGAPSAAAADFPRTITVPAAPGGTESRLDLAAAPQTIAALDYESAEVIAELGLAERLVLVPEAVTNPALGGHIAELSEVPHTIPVAMALDAETVLALAPDLVVMSPRHGAEDTIGSVLDQAGTPTLQLPDSWTDVAHVTSNIDLIGQATGGDAAAVALTEALTSGLTPAADPSGARVLVLSNQAGRPFITAGAAFPLRVLDLAGGVSVSEELGITTTGPISAEQIVAADPDAILLIDMNGSGERLFTDLLDNPAVAALPGAQRTLLVAGRDVQALGLTVTIVGLHTITEWLAAETAAE